MQANAQTTTTNLPILRRNMQGEGVLLLQQILISMHYLSPDMATGNFGSKTDLAVREFQAGYGLVIDGIVGTKTWNKFGEVLAQRHC